MSDQPRRANYVLLDFMEFLGDDEEALDVPWADFAGNRSSEQRFDVPTDDPTEAYVTVQAFDVGVYGHEILVNGDPVSGFDVPPGDGWQLWMDSITGAELVEGENTIRFVRDSDSDDSFVVGTVAVHWKEPVA
jgi:hypothetical protein